MQLQHPPLPRPRRLDSGARSPCTTTTWAPPAFRTRPTKNGGTPARNLGQTRETQALREQNDALHTTVKRLQKEVEELQERNSQLRSLHEQVALGPMGVLEEDGGDGGDRIHLLTFIRHRSEF